MVTRITDSSSYIVAYSEGLARVAENLFSNAKGMVFVVDEKQKLVGGVSKSHFLRHGSGLSELTLSGCIQQINVTADSHLPDDAIETLFTPSIQVVPLLDAGKVVGVAVAESQITHIPQGCNLNVGSGGYRIPGFVDLDLPSDWYGEQQSENIIHYDMRGDDLPFADSSVDNIYCSHVIEHVENEYVAHFLAESCRVLKSAGVLRIACPDAEFLHAVSSFNNEYWRFRYPWFRNLGGEPDALSAADFFIREVATPKSFLLAEACEQTAVRDVDFDSTTETLVNTLTAELPFNPQMPGNHINGWWFEKIKQLSLPLGFSQCIRSKYRGSVSAVMQGEYFDNTHPKMSLYVDLVK